MIIPDDKTQLGILLEFKNTKDENENLEKLAEKALLQMESKKYTAELKQRNLQQVLKVAIAFRDKTFVVQSKRQ